jgi:hypothetical protein
MAAQGLRHPVFVIAHICEPRAIFLFAFFVFSTGKIYGVEPNLYPQFSAHGSLRLDGSLDVRSPEAACFGANLNAGITGALSPRLSMDVLADNARAAIQSVYTSTNLLAALRYETDPARMLGSVIWYAPFGVEFEGRLAYGRGGASFEGQAGLSLNDILGLRDAPYTVSAIGGVSLSGQDSVVQASVYGAGNADFLPSFTYSRQTRARSEDGMDWRESESHLDISGTFSSVCSWSYSRDVYYSASAVSGAFRGPPGADSEQNFCTQSARIFVQLLEEAPLLAHAASLSAACEWTSVSAFSLLCRLAMNSASADGKRSRAIDIQCAYRRETAPGFVSAVNDIDIHAECQYSWASGVRAVLRYDAIISMLPEQNCAFAVSLARQRAAYQTELAYSTETHWSWRHSLMLGVGESWSFEALFAWAPPAAILTLSLAYQL